MTARELKTKIAKTEGIARGYEAACKIMERHGYTGLSYLAAKRNAKQAREELRELKKKFLNLKK